MPLGVPDGDVPMFNAWVSTLSPIIGIMTPEQIATATTAITQLLTFGGGPHACLGTRLARVTLEEVVRSVASPTPMLAVAPANIRWVQVLGVNPERLPVTVS